MGSYVQTMRWFKTITNQHPNQSCRIWQAICSTVYNKKCQPDGNPDQHWYVCSKLAFVHSLPGTYYRFICCFFNCIDFRISRYMFFRVNRFIDVWLLVGFNGPLRQYFSLYRAVTQRRRKRREKIDERKNVRSTPNRTYCKCNRPLPYYFPN